jgi:transcription antitermination factor NusG
MVSTMTGQFWVVLKTQPRREPIAAQSVLARGVEAYTPRLPGRDTDRRPFVFPGYLFARPTHETDDLLLIRSLPGIAYVLPRGGPPAQLEESVIQLLRQREAQPPHTLEPGDKVLVLAEPFRSLEAVFDRRLNAAGRVRVLLELAHRFVRVDISESQLQPAGGYSFTSG